MVILPETPTASTVNMPAPGHLAIELVALGGLVFSVLVISNAPEAFALPVDQIIALSASRTTERITISFARKPEPKTLIGESFRTQFVSVTIVAPSNLVNDSCEAAPACLEAKAA